MRHMMNRFGALQLGGAIAEVLELRGGLLRPLWTEAVLEWQH